MASQLEQAFEEIASNAVKATLAYARDEWIRTAQNKLKSTREDYIGAISGIYQESPYQGYIELQGKFPQMLETGFSSFDIKDGFLKSPKKKTTDTGWYMTIAFRHRTTGNLPNTMPKNVFNQAKRLGHGEQLKEALIRSLGYGPQTSHTGYTWKNSKYDNLTRIVKEYDSGKKHSQYLTYRRVSDKSDPASWIHPGYQGAKIVDEIRPKVESFAYDYFRS